MFACVGRFGAIESWADLDRLNRGQLARVCVCVCVCVRLCVVCVCVCVCEWVCADAPGVVFDTWARNSALSVIHRVHIVLRPFGGMTFCLSNFALVGLLYASACAGAMPDINVQYEFAPDELASPSGGSNFAKRTWALAKSIRQADTRMSQFSDVVGQALRLHDSKHTPSSFLSSQLQPVDASRVRKSLAATEPMVSPAAAAVNVIETEDVGAMLERAKYQGMLDEIARLHHDFEHGVAELAGHS